MQDVSNHTRRVFLLPSPATCLSYWGQGRELHSEELAPGDFSRKFGALSMYEFAVYHHTARWARLITKDVVVL